MYSKVVLRIFENPANAGRISKPDGIADIYNENETAHIEFSLRVESGIITDCKFRAQANPYIIAICSTITTMVKGKMISMLFLDPYSIKKELGDETDMDIMFCINCVKLAIDNYKEKLAKENKPILQAEVIEQPKEDAIAENNIVAEELENSSVDEELDDDFFADFFDDSELE